SGAVSSTGANSAVGGLVGANAGSITDSSASVAVSSAGANSTVGSLVGANAGSITDSTASGAVTSTGANRTVGALRRTSSGTITNSTGPGVVTSTGANSTINFIGVPSTGGTRSTSLPAFSPELLASLPGPVQVINNLVGIGPTQLAALDTAPVVNIPPDGGVGMPSQPRPPGPTGSQQGQQQQLPAGFDRRVIDIPPPTETRFVKDEVVLQIAGNVTVDRSNAGAGGPGSTWPA